MFQGERPTSAARRIGSRYSDFPLIAAMATIMSRICSSVLDQAKAGALTVPDVRDVEVRGRWTGRSLRLDVRAGLDPELTLGATEPIVRAIEIAVLGAVDEARVVEVRLGANV